MKTKLLKYKSDELTGTDETMPLTRCAFDPPVILTFSPNNNCEEDVNFLSRIFIV